MARTYPRFLFSNPQNVKGTGPYIVHLLYPRAVFKLFPYLDEEKIKEYSFKVYGGYFHTVLLDCELCPDEEKNEIVVAAHDWFHYQPEVNLFKKSQL
jgi:hypothetical protein